NNLRVTDGGQSERSSVFTTQKVDVTKFTSTFTFLISPGATSDGMTFTVQGVGNTALGAKAGGLGYQGIAKSVAIKFDLANNAGEGKNSTGIYTNGAAPTIPAFDLTNTLDLHSGDAMRVTLAYDGNAVVESITNLSTNRTFNHTYTGYDI